MVHSPPDTVGHHHIPEEASEMTPKELAALLTGQGLLL